MAVNKVAYDYQNIEIDIDGVVFSEGILSISYSDGVEVEEQFGGGREAVDETEGVYSAENAELEMHEWAYRNFIEKLGPGNMTKRKRFDVSVSYAHEGEPIQTDVLQRCRLIGKGRDHSQGPEGLTKMCTLYVKKVLENGIDPVAST